MSQLIAEASIKTSLLFASVIKKLEDSNSYYNVCQTCKVGNSINNLYSKSLNQSSMSMANCNTDQNQATNQILAVDASV